jgi:hypothetical protein
MLLRMPAPTSLLLLLPPLVDFIYAQSNQKPIAIPWISATDTIYERFKVGTLWYPINGRWKTCVPRRSVRTRYAVPLQAPSTFAPFLFHHPVEQHLKFFNLLPVLPGATGPGTVYIS